MGTSGARVVVLGTLVAVAALVGGPALGHAESGAAGEAKARYEKGLRHYNLGHFDEAVEHFEGAYELSGKPELLFNIAQCQRQLGNTERALFLYRRYLASLPEASNRKSAEGYIAELEGAQGSSPPAAKQPAEDKGKGKTPPAGTKADDRPVRAPAAEPEHIRVLDAVPFDAKAGVSPKVAGECTRLGRVLPAELAKRNRKVKLVTKAGKLAGAGSYLVLRITKVRAPGGALFSGPKRVAASGQLYRGGKVVADFKGQRSSMVGAMSTCSLLEKAEAALGQDVAKWLRAPRPGARL